MNVVYGDNRIRIPLLQPMVLTVTTTIFKVNILRFISTLFILTFCRCSLLMNDMEYLNYSSREITMLNMKDV